VKTKLPVLPPPMDPEPGHLRNRDGYPALASWIARDPDGETFVFRKFDRLAARHILHLQASILALEHEIDEQDRIARASADYEARQSSKSWDMLTKCAEDPNRQEKNRIETLEKLGTLLQEYCMSDTANATSTLVLIMDR
jgi:hypothetical protein